METRCFACPELRFNLSQCAEYRLLNREAWKFANIKPRGIDNKFFGVQETKICPTMKNNIKEAAW